MAPTIGPLGTVVLDTGPLSLVTKPARAPEVVACCRWLQALVDAGVRVCVPEIADYELRRELLRAGKADSVSRLDALEDVLVLPPLSTADMRCAAQLWADARNAAAQTAPDLALDVDAILASQAMSLGDGGGVVVATTNPGHLGRLVPASLWSEIIVQAP